MKMDGYIPRFLPVLNLNFADNAYRLKQHFRPPPANAWQTPLCSVSAWLAESRYGRRLTTVLRRELNLRPAAVRAALGSLPPLNSAPSTPASALSTPGLERHKERPAATRRPWSRWLVCGGYR
jgi:hypothetical protein